MLKTSKPAPDADGAHKKLLAEDEKLRKSEKIDDLGSLHREYKGGKSLPLFLTGSSRPRIIRKT